MSDNRVSNKQLLEAINNLTAAIAAQNTAQPAPAVTAPTESTEGGIAVDKAYFQHVATGKALDFANKHGEQVAIYPRVNRRGETKLAYCLVSALAGLKDRGAVRKNGSVGVIGTVDPTS